MSTGLSAPTTPSPNITLPALPAISLGDLTGQAALLTRLDRKYLLSVTDLAAFLDDLPVGTRALEIDGRREFAYRSVYFDTPQLDSYLLAAHHRRRRFKVRVRSYLDTGGQFLELKTRGSRGTTVKHRIPHDEDAYALSRPAQERLSELLTAARIATRPDTLGPTLTTTYRRVTLFVPATASRVTIDTGLGWARPDGTTLYAPDRAVVETKSARTTSEVDRLLWSRRHRPCSLSKYATGLAALRRDLPDNRWHPVLQRHFPRPTQENPR